ncbi:hypothetical protein [Cupriavidus taiwanensis]|uniref:hypothetical protein n=1 Tax=Cupriavidus taiwanensis TaxID=164546 RepID=UPI000E1A275C|nr:hypothetical protein [Cupriavidus taiwanensis]SOY70902.1 conserved hypothetical protein [Cupriavidus taiwanensis]
MAEKFVFREMEFRAGAHLWSNPKLRGTPAEIPIILVRPTLFDVVKLAQHYSLEALHLANRRLRVSREISERRYLRTDAILRNIDRIKAGHPAKIEEVARAIETDGDLPVPADPIPTAEQASRALAHWLPAGLPTFEQNNERYIYLTNVPFELEIVIRRWLQSQLESKPEISSTWLIHGGNGSALSQDGWKAFMIWLTDSLQHQLDQAEIGL